VVFAYKRIEARIGEHIAAHYQNVVEVGIGRNTDVAAICARAGLRVRATDIREPPVVPGVEFRRDDVYAPDLPWYTGADLVYAVRPGVEMVPPLIDLARAIGCDLIVYHLGNEIYEDGGEIIDCGPVLHRYFRA
jgi:uncharacterized UPF0146 family protein